MIHWLASYPRSGNSWTRAVLTGLMAGEDAGPVDIGALAARPLAIDRAAFDAEFDCTSSEMTGDEIDRLRPEFYRRMAVRAQGPLVVKLHCAHRRTPDGQPIFPPEATAGVVLIVRDPRDVAVSLAPFMSMTQDAAIAWMADESAELSGQRRFATTALPQRIGSWSSHVLSWIDVPDMRVHLVRYEALQVDPLGSFGGIAAFVGLDASPARLAEAIEQSRFERLHAQEASRVATPRFYRAGKAGGWRTALTAAQIDAIEAAHGPAMARLGYR